MNFARLRIKNNVDVKKINFCGNDIEVLQYLPIQDKLDLAEAVASKCFTSRGIINPFLISIYSDLYIFYMYTNVTFTEIQKKNELAIFDVLTTSGLMRLVLDNIPTSEKMIVCDGINDYLDNIDKANSSVSGVINKFINEMPINADKALNLIESFDPEKFKEVLQFAETLNGGRPFNQQEALLKYFPKHTKTKEELKTN